MSVYNEFSPSQKVAFDAANTGRNLFITGSGGNGKSYLIKKLITAETIVCAPTGIAALNISGVTCHKAFGLPIGLPTEDEKWKITKEQSFLLQEAERIIISEIGMVRIDYFDLIDAKLKKIRGNKNPFGGVQMILEGDFFQVEPILSKNEKPFFDKKYKHLFCFGSKKWNFEMFNLYHPQRHKKKGQYDLLNKIRIGNTTALSELVLEAKPYNLSDENLHLCCYKEDARNVNDYFYKKIIADEVVFFAEKWGDITEKDVMTHETLKIKKGIKVLLCANAEDYVNGDSGVITYIGKTYIMVRLNSGRDVKVERFVWKKYSYKVCRKQIIKEVTGEFEQFPITLGWAISIHKSQGMTLDSATIHTGKGCFSHGQFYVAVSRVKDLNELSLLRQEKITKRDIIVRDEVKAFYQND